MRLRTCALIAVLLLFTMTTPAVDAERTERHSGLVAAMDPGMVMILDEIGPWRVERGATVVTRHEIGLTEETRYNLFMRVNAPGAFPGDFVEVALDANDVTEGDFVTAECVRRGGRLVALTVTVAELPIGPER
jgi:hypothetical protein